MSLNIVIAESDLACASQLKHVISVERGYRVAGIFASAQSLLKAAEKVAGDPDAWDLILLSLHLPDSERSRTTLEIKRLLPTVPIITYTVLESVMMFLREIRTEL